MLNLQRDQTNITRQEVPYKPFHIWGGYTTTANLEIKILIPITTTICICGHQQFLYICTVTCSPLVIFHFWDNILKFCYPKWSSIIEQLPQHCLLAWAICSYMVWKEKTPTSLISSPLVAQTLPGWIGAEAPPSPLSRPLAVNTSHFWIGPYPKPLHYPAIHQYELNLVWEQQTPPPYYLALWQYKPYLVGKEQSPHFPIIQTSTINKSKLGQRLGRIHRLQEQNKEVWRKLCFTSQDLSSSRSFWGLYFT